MMNVDFVSFDLAVKLKEKGFREFCFAGYNKEGRLIKNGFPVEDGFVEYDMFLQCHNLRKNAFDAPSITQVLKWLREEKKIFVDVNSFPTYSTKEMVAYAVDVRCNSDGYSMENVESAQSFARWEEAALAGITFILDNIL